MRNLLVLLLTLLSCVVQRADAAEFLRCEYFVNPIGVDSRSPRMSWRCDADQSAYQIVVTQGNETLWDTGRVESDRSSAIAYAGKPLLSRGRYAWKVRTWDRNGNASHFSQPAFFEMGLLDPGDWRGKWIGSDAAAGSPAPMLRRGFEIKRKTRSARICISGVGYYELRLNGRNVGDRVLDPAFTNYDKRVLYSTYDVTDQLRDGKNAIGVILGSGWYDCHIKAVWNFHEASWRDRPKLLMELRIEFDDGGIETIVSDESWTQSTGPIVFDSIYSGENYDARLEKSDDAIAWRPVKLMKAPMGKLVSQQMPPIRVIDTLKPAKITELKPGVFLFDFAQNFAGVPQLHVTGPAGTTVSMRCGERLAADGTLDNANIEQHVAKFGNKQFQEDRYTLRGGNTEEVWQPQFTYHGFQYVQMTGFPGKPTLDNLRGVVEHTDLQPIGEFECSNDLLNRIFRAGRWSYLNNAHGYPTDCPTREKNGWMGDAHLAIEQGLLNFDGITFYEKWLNDIGDAQWPEGDLPGIVPTQGWGRGIGPAWDSALIIIPWQLYQYYGDTRALETHYDQMRRYVDYLSGKAKDGIVDYGLGDWAPWKAETPEAITGSAFYFRDATIVADTAKLLGKADDATKYAALADRIRSAFNARFFNAKEATYLNGTQTALGCALANDLVPADQRQRVLDNLIALIRKNDNHLDTGILGAKWVMDALLDAGRVDVGYAIASQKTQPSWGWWIVERGATTLYESWRDEDSRNHIMFGDVLAWFYKSLAGIRLDPAAAGMKHIIIRPIPVGDLTWARASHESVHGKISVEWHLNASQFELDVTIPPIVTASVYLPGSEAANEITSGTHHFSKAMK